MVRGPDDRLDGVDDHLTHPHREHRTLLTVCTTGIDLIGRLGQDRPRTVQTRPLDHPEMGPTDLIELALPCLAAKPPRNAHSSTEPHGRDPDAAPRETVALARYQPGPPTGVASADSNEVGRLRTLVSPCEAHPPSVSRPRLPAGASRRRTDHGGTSSTHAVTSAASTTSANEHHGLVPSSCHAFDAWGSRPGFGRARRRAVPPSAAYTPQVEPVRVASASSGWPDSARIARASR